AVMLLVLTAVAAFDARALRERGFASVPSPLWSLATPISYLARRARVDGADRGPLLIHLVLLGISFFGILLGISLGISHLAMEYRRHPSEIHTPAQIPPLWAEPTLPLFLPSRRTPT